ncbi:hypothetical protein HYY69_05040 [Candidatus Woesearchaeota archaeon]|nr:hypothetical protein [Candidatus Woesearchaeota archaeon]
MADPKGDKDKDPLNIDQLLELEPEERIKKLKEIQKEQEKTLEEAKKLIEQSEQELVKKEKEKTEGIEEKTKQVKTGVQVLQESLEEQLKEVKPLPSGKGGPKYIGATYLLDMYTSLKQAMDTGVPMNPYEKGAVEDMYLAINMLAEHKPQEGKLTPDQLRTIVQSSKEMITKIMGAYYAEIKYNP